MSFQNYLENIITNLKSVFLNYKYGVLFIILIGLVLLFFQWQTQRELIIANYGYTYFMWIWIIQYILAILLSLFITLSAYKVFYFSNASVKEEGVGSIASFFGILVAGCPACSLTIASYVGLAGFISFLPYDGLELKVFSIILLLVISISILNTLHVCKIKKKKTRKKNYLL